MTKEERMLVKIVCEEALTNEDENPYGVYRNLEDCYNHFSLLKKNAYDDCEHKFSEDVNYFFGDELANRTFTFTRILSYNKNTFTLLQGAYFFSKNGSLVALFRYDTRTRGYIRGFVLNKMSHDLIKFRKTISEIGELIRVNK